MRMKVFWGGLLAAGLLLTLSLAGAWAASDPANFTFDISGGNIVISDAGGGELNVAYGSSETAAVPSAQMIALTGVSTVNNITVKSGVAAKIALKALDIRLAGGCAFNMGGAVVELTLEEQNTLQSGAYSAGLRCPAGASLIISGAGSLNAAGGEYGAGIGGGLDEGCGSVTVNGGTVTAIGGTGEYGGGAGIGSGARCTEENGGGILTINGGTVVAAGAYTGGAGIGGGSFENSAGFGSIVFIGGGAVTATGNGGGAGIGSGSGGGYASEVNGGAAVISGGIIIAAANDGGAGIGGGSGCGGASVVIGGGSIRAGRIDGVPVNCNGVNVYLTTVTLEESPGVPAIDGAVCMLAADTAEPYGIKDLVTDDQGKLYLYLPAGTMTCAAQTVEGTAPAVYTTCRGSIRTADDGAVAGTLAAGPAPAQALCRGGSVSFTAPELGLTPLVITALGTDINGAIAAANLEEGRVTVTGLAAGDTALTVIYNNGSAESVPIIVREPQIEGDFVVAASNEAGYSYDPGPGVLLFTGPGNYIVSMKEGVAITTSGRIQVNGGTAAAPVCITLSGVGISSASCAFELQETSYVNLLLAEGTVNALTSGAGKAGVRCEGGATLVIGGPGELEANGGSEGAGIGGNSYADSGAIYINEGTVRARGGSTVNLNCGGAGIGGGYNRSAGNVRISGGMVEARGGNYAAGIGGGQIGKGGNITISGGLVTAAGGGGYGGGGAGIGSGHYVSDLITNICLSGGTVSTRGADGGAGIGGGASGNFAGRIQISGGTIAAAGGGGGAGIGSGKGGNLDQMIGVYISGGSINAQGSGGGQSIGKGENSSARISLKAAENGAEVHLTTVQLSGVTEAKQILDLVTGAGYAYGIHDVKTDARGRLCLYLPLGTATTAARAGGRVYRGSVITTDDPLTSGGTLMLSGEGEGAFLVQTAHDYVYGADGVLQILQPGLYSVHMAEGVAQTSTDRIVINAPLSTQADPVRLTINDLRIIREGNAAPCALEITPGSTILLDLVGQNTLKSGREHAGLGCPAGAVLTIGGSGALTATGGNYGAGIGGGKYQEGGRITITSGTIEAYNNYGAAGIGGGFGDIGSPCSGGEITITGGRVTAAAGSGMGAGIGGGGNGGCGGAITITGGNVTASGGSMGGASGAGIGGGEQGGGGSITITGGSINALAGTDGAEPIGHGANADDSGSLKNSGGENVFRTMISLQGVNAPRALTSFTASRAYGVNDVFTDVQGRLYFYLPQNTLTVAAQAAGREYTGSITTTGDHGASGTLFLSGEAIQLGAPVSLRWDGTVPGQAAWNAVPHASGYSVQLYKDGTAQGNAATVTGGTTHDFTSAIVAAGSGSYTFTVTALGDGTAYSNSEVSDESEAYDYTAPPVQLAKPAGPAWDGTVPGQAAWNAVPHASGYSVQLYKDGTAQGDAATVTGGTTHDFTSAIVAAGSGSYTFTVTALGDGTAYSNSENSDESEAYDYSYTSPVLTITTTELAEATVGSAYTQGISFIYTGGGTLTFSATGLPAGLSIDGETGLISGVPLTGAEENSPYSVEVKVIDGTLSDTAAFSLVVNAEAGPETFTITAVAGPGGSIDPGGALRVTRGDSITFTIIAEADYSISSVVVDGIDEGALSSYTFSEVSTDHTISAAFRYTGAGDGDDGEPDYIARRLTHGPSGIMVEGKGIHRNAQLIVTLLSLHPDDPACNAIRRAMAAGQLVKGFNIELTQGFQGELTISVPMDSRYNGQTLTILHCVNGRLESIDVTVVGGLALFTVTELSPFALVSRVLPGTDGNAVSPGLMLFLAIFAASGLCLLWKTSRGGLNRQEFIRLPEKDDRLWQRR